MLVEKKELFERLCALGSRVMREKFRAQIPFDCFCGDAQSKTTLNLDTFAQWDADILDFIESAVNAKLEDARIEDLDAHHMRTRCVKCGDCTICNLRPCKDPSGHIPARPESEED